MQARSSLVGLFLRGDDENGRLIGGHVGDAMM